MASAPNTDFSKVPSFALPICSRKGNTDFQQYANVTSGQRVELVSGSNGQPQALSGNKSVTAIASPVWLEY
jgi:hypothetical protein